MKSRGRFGNRPFGEHFGENMPAKTANKGFKFLEHTADIYFEASGKTFREALENSALALFECVGPAKSVEKVIINESAPSREDLVVFFLSRLLTEMDINEVVFSKVKITKLDEKSNSLSAEVFGEKKQPAHSVKAVTYHMLKVEPGKEGCKIRVVLDV